MEMVLARQGLAMQWQRDKYFEEGFLKLDQFFEKEKIERIQKEAKQIFVHQLKKLQLIGEDYTNQDLENAMFEFFKTDFKTFSNCGKQAQHLISLHALSLEPRLIELLKVLGLTFPIVSTRPVVFFNSRFLATKESYWKTPPHQDWRSIQGSINAMVVWVPLMDINIPLGAIELIPRSHKLGLVSEETVESFGLVRPEFRKDENFVPMEVKTGDIVIFSQFLIHRSGNNSTDSIRWSCHFRYNDLEEETFIDRGFPHTYIYKVDDTLINPGFKSVTYARNYFNSERLNIKDK